MPETPDRRVLVVTDNPAPQEALLAAVRHRAAESSARFRVVVPNPARAELHLLHPERHDKAAEAEEVLRRAIPALEEAAGGPVIASVSVQHDPIDAIEHTLQAEPIDEILLAVHEHGLRVRLHDDLVHRLGHLGIPVTRVDDWAGDQRP